MTAARWGLSTAHSSAALPKYTVTASARTSRAKLSAQHHRPVRVCYVLWDQT